MITIKNARRFDLFLAVGYMLFVLTTSLIPMETHAGRFSSVSDLNPKIQNLLHIPLFGVLSILLLRVFSGNTHKKPNVLIPVLIVCIAFGILNELIQFFVPGRHVGLLDMGLNVVGALTGHACWQLFMIKFRHR